MLRRKINYWLLSKVTLRYFLIADAALLCILAGLVLSRKVTPLDIRDASFSKVTSDRALIEADPAKLYQNHFIQANPVNIAKYQKRFASELAFPLPDPSDTLFSKLDVLEKVKVLIRTFSVNGTVPCPTEDLVGKANSVNKAVGFCSDHSQVFMALCLIYGIPVREISNSEHTVAGVFYKGEWVFCDPQFALFARDEQGNLLSMVELSEMILAGRKPVFETFGTEKHWFHSSEEVLNSKLYMKLLFTPKSSKTLQLTMGNNVFTQDIYHQKLNWLPKSINQFVSFAAGIRPGYLFYTKDVHHLQKKFTYIRFGFLYVPLMLFVSTLGLIITIPFLPHMQSVTKNGTDNPS